MGRMIVAVCLLASWLVASQHCGLEAAGLLAAHDDSAPVANCSEGSCACVHDSCHQVEEAGYRLDSRAAKLPTPTLADDAWLICQCLALREPVVACHIPTRTLMERPLDWVPTWQFVQRAALSPRAPSDASA